MKYGNTNGMTHGQWGTRLYRIWKCMKTRCHNQNHQAYDRYGARGITVCDEWKDDFQAFYDWAMANGYEDHLTIDRKENDKGYSPDNCRWVTAKVQANNRKNNVLVTINGETKTIAQWAEQCGLKYDTVLKRYNKGVVGSALIGKVVRQ